MLHYLKNNPLSSISLLFFLGSFLLYSVEALTFQGVVTKYLYVSPHVPALISLVFLFILRLRKNLPKQLAMTFVSLNTIFILLTLIAFLLDTIVHPNFVFSTFHVNPIALIPICIFLTLSTLTLLNRSFLNKRSTLLLILLPLTTLSLAFFLKTSSESIFYQITKEDSFVEYATMLVYLAVAYFGYKSMRIIILSKTIKSPTRLIYTALYLGIILISFVIAGEEISWGQRIIGFSTPEAIVEINTQREFNLHNNGYVFGHIYTAYFVLALYGSFAWLLQKGLALFIKKRPLTTFISFFSPPLATVGFFLPMVFLIPFRTYFFTMKNFETAYFFTQWEELTELILSFGIVLFIYLNYRLLKKHKKSLSPLLQG